MATPHATPHAPYPTPSSYHVRTRSALRAPIENPYDKFPQPEFDAWIGDITSALKRALGREEPPRHGLATPALPQDDEPADDSFALEDSFAEINARRAAKGKGKAKAAASDLGDASRPIELLSESEGEEEEEEGAWGAGWSDGEEETSSEEVDDEVIELLSEEDAERNEGGSSRNRGDDREDVDELEVDEIDEDEDRDDAHVDERDESSEDEEADEQEEPAQPIEIDDPWSGVRTYAEDFYSGGDVREDVSSGANAHHLRTEQGDDEEVIEISDDDGQEYWGINSDDVDARMGADVEDEDEDEDSDSAKAIDAQDESTEFPPPDEGETAMMPEIVDPWSGARTFAEDFYSGGDIRRRREPLSPSHLPADEDGVGLFSTSDIVTPQAAFNSSEDTLDKESGARAEAGGHGEGEEEFPPHDSPTPVAEIADPWLGPRIFAEDFYSGGDAGHGSGLSPSCLTAEDDAEMGMFITPGVITPEVAQTPEDVSEAVDNALHTPEGKTDHDSAGENPAQETSVTLPSSSPYASSPTEARGAQGVIREAEEIFETSMAGSNALDEIYADLDAPPLEDWSTSTGNAEGIHPALIVESSSPPGPMLTQHVDWNWPPAFTGRLATRPGHLQTSDDREDVTDPRNIHGLLEEGAIEISDDEEDDATTEPGALPLGTSDLDIDMHGDDIYLDTDATGDDSAVFDFEDHDHADTDVGADADNSGPNADIYAQLQFYMATEDMTRFDQQQPTEESHESHEPFEPLAAVVDFGNLPAGQADDVKASALDEMHHSDSQSSSRDVSLEEIDVRERDDPAPVSGQVDTTLRTTDAPPSDKSDFMAGVSRAQAEPALELVEPVSPDDADKVGPSTEGTSDSNMPFAERVGVEFSIERTPEFVGYIVEEPVPVFYAGDFAVAARDDDVWSAPGDAEADTVDYVIEEPMSDGRLTEQPEEVRVHREVHVDQDTEDILPTLESTADIMISEAMTTDTFEMLAPEDEILEIPHPAEPILASTGTTVDVNITDKALAIPAHEDDAGAQKPDEVLEDVVPSHAFSVAGPDPDAEIIHAEDDTSITVSPKRRCDDGTIDLDPGAHDACRNVHEKATTAAGTDALDTPINVSLSNMQVVLPLPGIDTDALPNVSVTEAVKEDIHLENPRGVDPPPSADRETSPPQMLEVGVPMPVSADPAVPDPTSVDATPISSPSPYDDRVDLRSPPEPSSPSQNQSVAATPHASFSTHVAFKNFIGRTSSGLFTPLTEGDSDGASPAAEQDNDTNVAQVHSGPDQVGLSVAHPVDSVKESANPQSASGTDERLHLRAVASTVPLQRPESPVFDMNSSLPELAYPVDSDSEVGSPGVTAAPLPTLNIETSTREYDSIGHTDTLGDTDADGELDPEYHAGSAAVEDPFRLMGTGNQVAPGAIKDDTTPKNVKIMSPGTDLQSSDIPIERAVTRADEHDGTLDDGPPSVLKSHQPELSVDDRQLADATSQANSLAAPSRKRKRVTPSGIPRLTRSMTGKIPRPTRSYGIPIYTKRSKMGKGKEKQRLTQVDEGDTASITHSQATGSTSASSSHNTPVNMLTSYSQTSSRASSVGSSAPSNVSVHTQFSPSLVPHASSSHVPPPPPLPFVHAHGVLHHHHGRPPSLVMPPPPQRRSQQNSKETTPTYVAPVTDQPSGSLLAQESFEIPITSSPVTRSNCRFHKISLPREENGPRVFFVLPGCSLGDAELMQEQDIIDHGPATLDDQSRLVTDIEALDFSSYLLGTIRQLVGVDLLREQEVFYLPQVGENYGWKSKRKSHTGKAKLSQRESISSRSQFVPSSPRLSQSSRRSSAKPPASKESASTSGRSGAFGSHLSARGSGSASASISGSVSESELSDFEYNEGPGAKRRKTVPRDTPPSVELEAITAESVLRAAVVADHRLTPRRGKRLGVDAAAFVPEHDSTHGSDEDLPAAKGKRGGKRGVKRSRTDEPKDDHNGNSPSKKRRVRKNDVKVVDSTISEVAGSQT